MLDKTETLADDLLDGAEEIADFIKKLTARQVYHYQAELGLTHLGGKHAAAYVDELSYRNRPRGRSTIA